MRRTERLFQIIQVLRSRRRPVTGRELSEELEVSLRTLYRDMAELVAQRVPVRGEAGTGYVIDADFDMPPLMLTPDELEAAALGAAWVARRGDPALARGARDLIGKLAAVAPDHLRAVVLDGALEPVAFRDLAPDGVDLSAIRSAIRARRKVTIAYADVDERLTIRTIWPFLIAYAEQVRMICAWCELRGAFRHFRTDRIRHADVLDTQFPERVATLRRRWEDVRKREREERGC